MGDIPDHNPTVEAIYRWYEDQSENPRAHLGASLIGRECPRELWYSFRWVTKVLFKGRVLRLFETGQLAEERFIKNLRDIGVTVYNENKQGHQYRFKDHGGHFAGSVDGVVIGIFESPKTAHLAEYKTHGEKSFNHLKAHGVQKAKPEHVAQMQVYMHYMKLTRAMYMAVNKNTDELYVERIKYEKKAALLLIRKAKDIIDADVPPTGISKDPSFYKCKFCDHADACHQGQLAEVNCRTCLHSTPIEGGWHCNWHKAKLSYEKQIVGCEDHLFIPALVPLEVHDAGDDWVAYTTPDGNKLTNRNNSKTLGEMLP